MQRVERTGRYYGQWAGRTVVLGLQQYNQMTAELELLRSLAEAEEDVKNGRIDTVQGTFDDIRAALNAGR